MSLLWTVINVILFLAGVAAIPFLAFGLRGLLPAFIAEPLASGLLWLVMLARGPSTLYQTHADDYELRAADPDDTGPRRHWGRFIGQRLGLDYDRDETAFGEYADEIRPSDHEPDDDISVGERKRSRLEMTRGGYQTFVEHLDASKYVFVRVGEYLARLKDQAATAGAYRATREGAREFGGDTSTSSQKFRFVSFFLMLVLGVGSGYLVFF